MCGCRAFVCGDRSAAFVVIELVTISLVAPFLIEQHPNLKQTMFVSVFWSGVLPTGLFVTSIALMINYW